MNNYITQGIKGLLRSKSRTLLTALGIIIGVATVVLVLAAGEGFKGFINAQLEQFGSNTITIETQVPPSTRQRASGSRGNTGEASVTSLKQRDIESIARVGNVKGVYGAVVGQAVSGYGSVLKNAFIFGADAQRFAIDKGVIAQGRPYTESEDRALAQVALLGADIATQFFGDRNPIGETIRIGNYNFTVIGVYAPRGSFGFSNDDEQIFIPARTLQKKILGIDHYFFIVVELYDNTIASLTRLDIEDVLRRNHNITDPAKDDFVVQTQEQNLEIFNTILSATTFLLIAIAAISLIVGGVGVMNIMYVVVNERTQEIGLKKALGATPRVILLEFLFEALLLTLVGGILGVIAGSGMAFIVYKIATLVGFPWVFAVPVSGILLGVGVSLCIGIIFGVAPARAAARLNPIEALRYE